MNLLIDMNLSPLWCAYLDQFGFHALHWSTVGSPSAPDAEIMAWARKHGYVVLTHDLDFGAMLAATSAISPSVIQLRVQDVLPDAAGVATVNAIRQHTATIEAGALVSIDSAKYRLRVLPLRR